MQIGFIGTGSMGTILIEAFIQARVLAPSHIHAANRTFSKVKELAQIYTGLHAYPTNIRVAQRADVIFLCVKPLEFKQVVDEIAPFIHDRQLIVSITSPIQIEELEQALEAKIAKIIPSITNSVGKGASLIIAGSRCTEEDKQYLQELMSGISRPVWIEEHWTRVSSDIASCGPAFLSFMLQEMIEGAVRKTGISREQATTLTTNMIVGLGELFKQGKFTLQSLQERVCVPGGVTGAGLGVLEKELSGVFDKLFQETHRKFDEDRQQVIDMFSEYEAEELR
ncbi:late competence protein ComER [Bacillus horti]|nr:late competence protein ComER [Bacillus horti]